MAEASDKIGIGVITFKRKHYCAQVIEAVNKFRDVNSVLTVVNDGPEQYVTEQADVNVIRTPETVGVAKAKNLALKHLLSNGCEHIFLIEDDILLQSKDVFKEYIDTANTFGIYHLCYNKCAGNEKTKLYEYTAPNGKSIGLYRNPQGAFMYFHRKIVEKFGLFDEKYLNAFEHIDYEYNLCNQGLLPPFWAFADVLNTDSLLKPIPGSDLQSTITDKGEYSANWQRSAEHFVRKWGKFTSHIPRPELPEITKSLQTIEASYARKKLVNGDKKLLVVIPYRDRKVALGKLLDMLPKELEKYTNNFKIVVVESMSTNPFRKGWLNNIGFHHFRDWCDYVCFHDVDLVPLFSDYSYPETPTHLSTHCSQFNYIDIPDKILGGVITFRKEHFIQVNGYSNLYEGWGKEDDDLYHRCELENLPIYKHPFGTYFSVPHPHRLTDPVEVECHKKNGEIFQSFLKGDINHKDSGVNGYCDKLKVEELTPTIYRIRI